MFGERNEVAGGLVERIEGAVLDVVDPAVQGQPVLRHGQGHRGMGAQVVQLRHHVGAHHAVDARLLRRMVDRFVDHARRVGMVQPAAHGRHVLQAGAGGDRLHGAAVGVAANDDVAHVQGRHGKFHRGADAARLRPVRRHDVARVADDEELARLALRHQFRHHAAVRAGNEQGLGRLSRRQGLEQLAALRKNLFLEA